MSLTVHLIYLLYPVMVLLQLTLFKHVLGDKRHPADVSSIFIQK